MSLLHTADNVNSLQGQVSPSSRVTDVKALENDHVFVTSMEVASETASESHSDDDASSPNVSQEAVPQPSSTLNSRQAGTDIVPTGHAPKPEVNVLTAIKVLQVIETYGNHDGQTDTPWHGLAEYVPLVNRRIRAGEKIPLLFSGFPFKSPRVCGKVLGNLPDLGEKLALGHLNGLCSNIAAVYKHGAEVHICLDGLVYNDLLGISDESVWSYGDSLRRMAELENFQHLKFVQISDLLGHEAGTWTREYARVHAPCIRRELLYRSTANNPFDSDAHRIEMDAVIGDYVAQMLSPDEHEAQANLIRSLGTRYMAYASAVQANRPDYIQLSSNKLDFTRSGSTLTMSLLPRADGSKACAPWHSVIAIELDGRYRTTHVSELRNDEAYDLVLDAAGTPSHYRAKADMWDWKVDGVDVTFEHLYPTGTIIRPNRSGVGTAPSIRDLPMRKVRLLSQVFSPIVLRGFSETTNEEYFLSKGHELGNILTWTFGQILKVKDSGEVDKNANNVTSNEAMPMHFDGIFKFVDTVDPATGAVKKVLTPPRYQYFTCITTAPKGDGYTLFANSRLFFQHLPFPFRSRVSKKQRGVW